MAILLTVYFLAGIIATVWVMAAPPKLQRKELEPLGSLADPVFGWVFLFLRPVLLLILVVDRNAEEVKAAPQEHLSDNLIGQRGEVATELRPGGRMWVNGKLYDAITPQRFLATGTPVVVTSHRLGELTVDRVNRARGDDPVR